MSNNANLPPIRVGVIKSFLGIAEPGFEKGHLVSVRSMLNQALQFSVLLDSGALYTGLPINSLCHYIKRSDVVSPLYLKEAQAYDCIGNDIEILTIQSLLYMNCTVKPWSDHDIIWSGVYLFTIDFVDSTGLSRHPEQWKQFHCIALDNGNIVAYPQYRLRFQDGAFCPDIDKPMPKYGYNTNVWLAE
jgi:hypothetical protein